MAIVALKIWKLSPNVPSMNTITSSTTMSGLERTYLKPPRVAPFFAARGEGWSSSVFIMSSAANMPTKDRALMRRAGGDVVMESGDHEARRAWPDEAGGIERC